MKNYGLRTMCMDLEFWGQIYRFSFRLRTLCLDLEFCYEFVQQLDLETDMPFLTIVIVFETWDFGKRCIILKPQQISKKRKIEKM